MWYPGKRKRVEARGADAAPEMTLDCQRLLDGSYLDSLCAGEHPVPCWAWLNKLTHCDPVELETIAGRPPATARRPELHAWARTVSFLARELLQVATRCGRQVDELQRAALLPLEVELMGVSFGPSELTRRVLVAFEETARHRT